MGHLYFFHVKFHTEVDFFTELGLFRNTVYIVFASGCVIVQPHSLVESLFSVGYVGNHAVGYLQTSQMPMPVTYPLSHCMTARGSYNRQGEYREKLALIVSLVFTIYVF